MYISIDFFNFDISFLCTFILFVVTKHRLCISRNILEKRLKRHCEVWVFKAIIACDYILTVAI